MPEYLIYTIGFAAQILFSARLIIQWVSSEKAKRVTSPILFWQLSIIASFLLLIYGWLRDDFAIILGQIVTYFIYIANLHLQNRWKVVPKLFRLLIYLLPLTMVVYFANNYSEQIIRFFQNEDIPTEILIWGMCGQILFTLRFVYQWFYSSRAKESLLPLNFWILSLAGSSMIISYAIYRNDPVLIMGQSCGVIVYARNIYISRLEKRSKSKE